MEIARVGLIQSNKIIKRSLDEWQILPWLKMETKEVQPYYDFEQRRLTFGIVGLKMNVC